MRIWPLVARDRKRETTPEPIAGSGDNAHARSREALCAEVLEWWEREQERVYQELEQRHVVIRGLLGQLIQSSSRMSLLSGEKFVQERVEPLVGEFIESTYRDLFEQMEKSFFASVADIEARNATIDIEDWSYGKMARMDGRIAYGFVPLAPLLKWKGVALVGVGILILTQAESRIVQLGAAGAAAIGLIHMLRVKQRWKDHLDPIVKLALFGDNAKPEVESLRGVLLSELRTAAQSRMEAIRQ